jgi:hypothetical protein
VKVTALWNVKRMPPSLLGAAELSLLNMLKMLHVFPQNLQVCGGDNC